MIKKLFVEDDDGNEFCIEFVNESLRGAGLNIYETGKCDHIFLPRIVAEKLLFFIK